MEVRVADYIAQTLARRGITDVFLVTGGGAMHLNDAIGRCKALRYICCHHEQACSMAAESYFRLTGRAAAVNVTTGPGGTNAITGVMGAWTDSLGMVVVSGQVKRETMVRSYGTALRQLGDQEVDIVTMVSPITKYAAVVMEPTDIRYCLEKAIHLATSGRPGPVWIDVPSDVQGAKINPETLRGYDPAEDALHFTTDLPVACQAVMQKLKSAKRPVILAGCGVRIGRAQEEFLRLADRLQIPVVTGWNAHDLIANSHPYYIGRPGTVGDRPGNFAIQSADVLLVLGCRLNIRMASYVWQNFASKAFKIIVDIDQLELEKPTVRPQMPIHADVKAFLQQMLALPCKGPSTEQTSWLEWCRIRKEKYPAVLRSYRDTEKPVNPYCFVEELFRAARPDEIIVTGDGTACVVTFQGANIQLGQRLYTNGGCASMGYDLPAAIGACIASGGKRVVCLAGDGSIQMNLQELQTIVGLRLPIKLFVLNNDGYHSIRQTQQNFFADNLVGCGPDSQLTFPAFERLAYAYQIPFRKCSAHSELPTMVAQTLNEDGPQMCEVVLDMNQQFAPKLASKRLPDGRMTSPSLEDMAPFLDKEELESNRLG